MIDEAKLATNTKLPAQSLRTFVGFAMIFGIGLSATGIGIGLHIGFKRRQIPCSDTSGSISCYSYDHAAEGAAVIVVCGVLLLLVVTAGFIGREVANLRQAQVRQR